MRVCVLVCMRSCMCVFLCVSVSVCEHMGVCECVSFAAIPSCNLVEQYSWPCPTVWPHP